MSDTTKAPSADSYDDATGRANVDPNAFLAEGEGNATEDGEPSTDTTTDDVAAAPEDTETTDTPADTETSDPAPESTPPEEPKLYAGKYKDVEALKEAFRELGGNPDEYQDEKLLEEAYKVRQREYTRVHQTKPIEEDPPAAPTDDDIVNEVVASVDYSKVKNVQDAIRESVRAALQAVKKANPGIDKESLVTELSEGLQKREEKQSAIREVETEVPRLKTDKKFRSLFAHHVMDQQKSGDFVNLKQSMKDFLNTFSGIVQESKKVTDQQTNDKGTAVTQPDTTKPTSTENTRGDEADDIQEAYNNRKRVFGD